MAMGGGGESRMRAENLLFRKQAEGAEDNIGRKPWFNETLFTKVPDGKCQSVTACERHRAPVCT